MGAGIGAALGGMRPIVEIMAVNFSLLALYQVLNNAATLRHMPGGQLSVPMVARMAQFMSNVREERKIGEGRYHWVVAGPAGVSVEWDAEIMKLIPDQLIAFKSLEGSAIEQAGLVHLNATSEGDTCVDIKLSYNPPAGAIGHLIAMLFGADPKKEMDEDLMRMKSFIETGQAPHDAASKIAHKAS